MAEPQVTKSIRTPGIIERYYIARSSLGFYNNVGVTASYTIPSGLLSLALRGTDSTSAIKALIYQILAQIIPQHPPLGISFINGDTKTPAWKHLDSIDLTKLVTFAENGQKIEEQIASLHSQPLLGADGTLPLWHVLISQDSATVQPGDPLASPPASKLTVGFFFNHAIGDGFSGAAFQYSFHSALNATLSSPPLEDQPITTIRPPQTSLLPTFETAVPLSISAFYILKVLYHTVFPTRGIWTGPAILFSLSQPAITRLSVLNLPVSRVTDLVALCRRQKTSITALLIVVLAGLLAEKLGEEGEEVNGLVATVAVTMRRFAQGVTKRDMVAYTSGMNYTFLRSNAAGRGRLGNGTKNGKNDGGVVDWDEVRRLKGELDQTAGSTKNQYAALLKLIPDMPGFLKGKVGKPREGSFEVSNLGVVDFGEEVIGKEAENGENGENGGKVKCERVIFGQAANVTGTPWVFSVATAKGGDMSIVLSWQEGVLKDAVVKSVVGQLDELLAIERLDGGNGDL